VTTSSESAAGLLPATRRALTHRVAVGQAEGRTPTLAAAVVRDGGQAWFGSRSMLDGHEPDGDTQYRIGSLTKTFIAVLVMRLRDEGRLDLADLLGKHLDAGEAAGATIAQLLAHTAGLASETPGPWWERSPGELRPGLADILSPAPHPAGRLFHYSNPGYGLLGALIGQLRGHGWEEALRQEILDPLGMARTTLAPQEPHARGFAVHPWADVMQLEPADPAGLMAPAGELWSTAEDLCRFAVFLLDGDDRVLPAVTLAEMRAPASPPGDEAGAGGYGLGLQLFRHDGRMLYGHSGSMPGFLATLCVSPADGVGAITLANATSGPDIGGIAFDLVRVVTDNEPRRPDRWQPLPEVDQALLALTGPWYWGPRAYVLRLVADRGLELAPATGRGRASQFRAEPDGTWTGLDGYYTGETLRLVSGADGTVDHLDLGSFVFTREPYGADGPLAARPDPEGWRAFLAGRSGDKEPAADVDLVQVEQFRVALGPPARFQVGPQVAYHAFLDGPADPVPDRYRAPDLLVEVRLRPPPVGGEVAVPAVPRDRYRLQPGADRAGPLGQRRPAGAQLRVLGHVVAGQPEVTVEAAGVEMEGHDAAGDAPHLPVAGDNVRPVLVGRHGHRGVE
jgi:CubicO group peptidase (beta-lactamase class C family)